MRRPPPSAAICGEGARSMRAREIERVPLGFILTELGFILMEES